MSIYETDPYLEGYKCRLPECKGVYGFEPVENCSCHISPPCNACVENPLVCSECGDNLTEYQEAHQGGGSNG